jgi:hypothetical protein
MVYISPDQGGHALQFLAKTGGAEHHHGYISADYACLSGDVRILY